MKFLLHPVRLLHPVCFIDTTEYVDKKRSKKEDRHKFGLDVSKVRVGRWSKGAHKMSSVVFEWSLREGFASYVCIFGRFLNT